MQVGRKILNLRCDRNVSQQELARICGITPSALSKIEAGINAPRAHIIWRIAQQLGVTVEYLLDERTPYPYSPDLYRHELVETKQDPDARVQLEATVEEARFVQALRKTAPLTREIAYSLPRIREDTLRLADFLLHHSREPQPDPRLWEHFQNLLSSGGGATADRSDGRARPKAKKKARKR